MPDATTTIALLGFFAFWGIALVLVGRVLVGHRLHGGFRCVVPLNQPVESTRNRLGRTFVLCVFALLLTRVRFHAAWVPLAIAHVVVIGAIYVGRLNSVGHEVGVAENGMWLSDGDRFIPWADIVSYRLTETELVLCVRDQAAVLLKLTAGWPVVIALELAGRGISDGNQKSRC